MNKNRGSYVSLKHRKFWTTTKQQQNLCRAQKAGTAAQWREWWRKHFSCVPSFPSPEQLGSRKDVLRGITWWGKESRRTLVSLPAVDACSLCCWGPHSLQQGCLECPHCICSWDRTTVRPALRVPRCSGAPLSTGGCHTPCHILNQGCHCSVPDSQASVTTRSHHFWDIGCW